MTKTKLLFMCHACGHCEEEDDRSLTICPHCFSHDVSHGTQPPFKRKSVQRKARTLSGNVLRGWQKNHEKNHLETKDSEPLPTKFVIIGRDNETGKDDILTRFNNYQEAVDNMHKYQYASYEHGANITYRVEAEEE